MPIFPPSKFSIYTSRDFLTLELNPFNKALDIGKIFQSQRGTGDTEIKKLPNFFARAKKIESSFFALAKNEKLKALCLCDLCVNLKKVFLTSSTLIHLKRGKNKDVGQ
jgi:hypothetical protein